MSRVWVIGFILRFFNLTIGNHEMMVGIFEIILCIYMLFRKIIFAILIDEQWNSKWSPRVYIYIFNRVIPIAYSSYERVVHGEKEPIKSHKLYDRDDENEKCFQWELFTSRDLENDKRYHSKMYRWFAHNIH